jgi:hypothetical protein
MKEGKWRKERRIGGSKGKAEKREGTRPVRGRIRIKRRMKRRGRSWGGRKMRGLRNNDVSSVQQRVRQKTNRETAKYYVYTEPLPSVTLFSGLLC